MDPEHRQLVNWLFAAAMAMLEDASAMSVVGQSSVCRRVRRAHGRRLQATL